MRALAVFAVVAAPAIAFATTPQHVCSELAQLKNAPVTLKVSALPKSLRRSLGRAFRDPHLDLASAGDPVREFHGHIVGDPASDADAHRPYRRLIFAFETPSFYVVYYEHRAPVAGAALVFSKARQPQFLWGGVDFDEPWARSPKALARRILQNRLNDEHKYYW